ncbi:MAG: 8-amino-7-oxononanoate synthase [Myxococcota bacterium]|jgi:8-amino-7-oxononanoate synthase|nr:8-amino-7-oxononanoate synthase [Myxococcota bacterium]
MSLSVLAQRALDLSSNGLERRLRTLTSPVGPVVRTTDGPKLLFCSNDYLGLAGDPALARLFAEKALELGCGAAGSRLVCGNTASHDALEAELAAFLGTEAAVIFPSGYQANLGAIGALTETQDVIFSDELCHASIIDGCRLSRAKVRVFPHRDLAALERALAESTEKGLRLVVTDAVFSMDGDVAPVRDIQSLCERYGAVLYVDEAHSLGIVGPRGAGLCAAQSLPPEAVLRIGTFGKALGLCGAFLACGNDAARLVRSRGRSQMYSTAAPPLLIEAVRAALRISSLADERRAALHGNIAKWRELAHQASLPILASDTPIQPVLIGDEKTTMEVSAQLWQRGVFVQGIRPPTVPAGTSRLRITITAAHHAEHIERLVTALSAVLLLTSR